jgi:hypothetical protein
MLFANNLYIDSFREYGYTHHRKRRYRQTVDPQSLVKVAVDVRVWRLLFCAQQVSKKYIEYNKNGMAKRHYIICDA